MFQLLRDIAAADTEIFLLMVLLVTTVIVLDGITYAANKKRRQAGISKESTAVSIEGSNTLPIRNYVSDIQGLAGRPDAVIMEHGYPIPVERKPLAKKVRDRYVAQILVYMRLLEEFEGKKPPYGYLVLGPNCRRFKVENTDQRQEWLQKMIDEMHDVLEEGKDAVPDPHPKKCKKCPVRESCEFAIKPQTST